VARAAAIMVVVAGTTVIVAKVTAIADNGASPFRRARAIRLFMAVSSAAGVDY
jgi:hypothetical protein